MAIQVGTYKGSVSKNSGWYEFWVTLIESEVNETAIANNQTTVTAIAKLKRISYYTFDTVNSNQTQTINIGGNSDSTNIRVDITGTNQGGEIELWRRSVPITHNDDGSKTVNISIRCNTSSGTYAAGLCSFDADLILSTIPRASSVTATTANIGEATTITINKKVSSFTHTLTYTFGSLSGTIATKTANSSVGWTIPTTFYAQIPNSKTGTGKITCTTYNGNTVVGTSTTNLNVTVKESTNLPKVTIVAADTGKTLPTGNTTTTLTGSDQKIIKGISSVKVTATATGQNSATISSKTVSCGDGQTSTSLTPTFANVNNGKFTITAKDSRGFTNSASKTLTMINYTNIKTTTVVLSRVSQTSGTIKLNLAGTYFSGSFGSVNNDITLKYRYKLSSTSTWGSYTTLTLTKSGSNFNYSNERLLTGLDYQKSYNFQLVLTDKVQIYTLPINISKGVPIFDYGEDDFRVNYPMTAPTINGYTTNTAMTKGVTTLSSKGSIGWTNQSDGDSHLITKSALSYWNGAYANQSSNLLYCSEGQIQAKPVSLYDNSSGTTGTVKLSQTAANFTFIEIYYQGNSPGYRSMKMYSPNSKNISLIDSFSVSSDNLLQIGVENILVSGTSITRGGELFANITSAGVIEVATQTAIKIIKVVGYK